MKKISINPKQFQKPLAALTMVVAIGAVAGGTSIVNAQVASAQQGAGTSESGPQKWGPMVAGTVAAVNGTTITVTGTGKDAGTTYTVDASKAEFHKRASGTTGAPSTATIADIAVDDAVVIRGTVSGTAVTATDVMDGVGPMMGRGGMMGHRGDHDGARGTISAIAGTTITITRANGTTYTVDASNAKIEKVSSIAVGDLKVGDTIGAEGTVTGTNVKAEHIIDGIPLSGAQRGQ